MKCTVTEETGFTRTRILESGMKLRP